MSEPQIIGPEAALEALGLVIKGYEDLVYCTGKNGNCVNFMLVGHSDGIPAYYPSCMVGELLKHLEVPRELIPELVFGSVTEVNEKLIELKAPFHFSNDAVAVLGVAQAAQDDRRPWGEALQEARNYYLEKYSSV